MQRLWPLSCLLGIAGVMGALVWICTVSDGIPFLIDHSPAHWIRFPSPASTRAHPAVPVETAFRRPFLLEEASAQPLLRLRAFRHYRVFLDEKEVARSSAGNWKRANVHTLGGLEPGNHELRVTVTNDKGPPALWLTLTSQDSQENLAPRCRRYGQYGYSWEPHWALSSGLAAGTRCS
jgi:hypothetical protein